KIYNEIRSNYEAWSNGDKTDWPIDPVVRLEDGIWMIESSQNETSATVQCTVDQFASYFGDVWHYGYNPDKQDEQALIAMYKIDC
ncbi:MAG: hypothetical protein WC346_11290, partial [Methanogenium sp.]